MGFVEGDESWWWYLKVDPTGLYRWYLADDAPTSMRGVTRDQADQAIRRFVEQSLLGELRIIEGEQSAYTRAE